MSVTFVLGRAGAGKTRFCIDAVLAELERAAQAIRPGGGSDQPQFLLLVPEQASFQTERALALRSTRHGYWQAEVLTFTRLAQRVLEDDADGGERLTRGARRMALRRLALKDPGRLDVFGPAGRTPGFFSHLERLIGELLAEEVTPASLGEAAARLPLSASRARIEQLSRLYGDYLAWLGPGRVDPKQYISQMRARIRDAAWLRGALIWVDGFASFAGQELAALVALARVAARVHVTLLLDPEAPPPPAEHPLDPLALFRRTQQTYRRLLSALTEAGVEVLPPIKLASAPLPRFAGFAEGGRLEAGLCAGEGSGDCGPGLRRPLEGSASPGTGAGAARRVRIVECATPREELRAAAREIRLKMAGTGDAGGPPRFRDFAIIVRDVEPYAALIADVLDDYDIPFFIDRRRPLSAHALPRFVLALLEALASDLSPAAAVDLLETDLLPLNRDQAERLDLLVHRHGLRGFDTWRRARWQFDDPRGHFSLEADFLVAARCALVSKLEPLFKRTRGVRTPTGADWARELYETLRRLGVRRCIKRWIEEARRAKRWDAAEAHRQAWEGLIGVLDDLHAVLGDTPLDLSEVSHLVSAALREQTLATPPPTLDQVLVSSIERSRHPDIKQAWVLAFNDGVFPARPADDPLLRPDERRALMEAGLPGPAGHADDVFDERLLAYIALTRPSQGLTISYSRTDFAGEEAQPSPLLADVRAILPDVTVEGAGEDDIPVCVNEFARAALAARESETASLCAARHDPLEASFCADEGLRPTVERALRGRRYVNEPAPVGVWHEHPVPAGVLWRGSPSRLETFIDCPFKYFAKYVLRLDTQREPRPLAMELGQWAHELLAGVVRAALDGQRDVRVMRDDEWLELLRETVQAVERPPHPPPADRAFLRRMQIRRVEEVLLAHAARWRRGRLTPVGVEQAFQADTPGGWPELELALPGGVVRITGKIDRVDTLRTPAGEMVLIYDYKTTPPSAMKNARFLTQARFQLFTYLLAASAAWRSSVGEVVSCGVLVAPLGTKLDSAEGVRGDTPEEQRMNLFRPQGLVDEALAEALDVEARVGVPSPVANIRRNKNGAFHYQSDVRPREEMLRRLALARRTIVQAAQGLIEGRIDIAPLVEERTFACTHCDFKPICRFEREANRARPAEKHLPVLQDGDGAEDVEASRGAGGLRIVPEEAS